MNVWDQKWKDKKVNLLRETSLSFPFSRKAYGCISEWIDGTERKILEVGCGTGRFCLRLAEEYPDAEVVGIDISVEAVEMASAGAAVRGIRNVRFIRADAFNIPFPEGYFDLVFSEGVVEHFPEPEKPVQEMTRVTGKNRKVLVSVINWFCLPHTIFKKLVGPLYEYGYEKSYTHRELKALLEKCGLSDIEFSGFLPIYWLSRQGVLLDYIAKFIEYAVIGPLDAGSGRAVSKIFGFEIFAKGIKK